MSITEAFPQRIPLVHTLLPHRAERLWPHVYSSLRTHVGYLAVIHGWEDFSNYDPEKTADLLASSGFLVPSGVISVVAVHNPTDRARSRTKANDFVQEMGAKMIISEVRGVMTGQIDPFDRQGFLHRILRKNIVDIAGVTDQSEQLRSQQRCPNPLQQLIVSTSKNPNHVGDDGLPFIETLRFISKEPGSDLWLPLEHS